MRRIRQQLVPAHLGSVSEREPSRGGPFQCDARQRGGASRLLASRGKQSEQLPKMVWFQCEGCGDTLKKARPAAWPALATVTDSPPLLLSAAEAQLPYERVSQQHTLYVHRLHADVRPDLRPGTCCHSSWAAALSSLISDCDLPGAHVVRHRACQVRAWRHQAGRRWRRRRGQAGGWASRSGVSGHVSAVGVSLLQRDLHQPRDAGRARGWAEAREEEQGGGSSSSCAACCCGRAAPRRRGCCGVHQAQA